MPDAVPWDDLHVFLVLRREATFAAAARILDVDATTVSRRLSRLEERLGTQLFQRTPDALVPTPEAESIVDSVEGMERQASRVASQIAGRNALVEGVVRIAATPHFARSFLFPRLAPLCAQHPLLQIEIVPGQRRADLTRDEADLALRFQLPGASAPADATSRIEIQSRRLASFPIGVYASREYIARAGKPKNAYALRGHDIVFPNEEAPHIPGRPWLERVRSLGRASIRVDVSSMAAAVSAGFGVGAVVDLYAQEFPNLIQLTPPDAVDTRDLWILMPTDLVRVARVRAVWDFIVDLATKGPNATKASKPKAKTGSSSGSFQDRKESAGSASTK
jgi:DNA-binding transcriptional LysR family regulator